MPAAQPLTLSRPACCCSCCGCCWVSCCTLLLGRCTAATLRRLLSKGTDLHLGANTSAGLAAGTVAGADAALLVSNIIPVTPCMLATAPPTWSHLCSAAVSPSAGCTAGLNTAPVIIVALAAVAVDAITPGLTALCLCATIAAAAIACLRAADELEGPATAAAARPTADGWLPLGAAAAHAVGPTTECCCCCCCCSLCWDCCCSS